MTLKIIVYGFLWPWESNMTSAPGQISGHMPPRPNPITDLTRPNTITRPVLISSLGMGNDSSKQQLHPNPRGVHRRLSTDSARRYKTGLPPPVVQVSASCSDGFLSPTISNDFSASTTSRTSVEGHPEISRSRSGSACSERSNSIKKKHPIVLRNRQLIQSCFQNPHEIIGKKIIKRTAEKRSDFGGFYVSLTAEQKEDLENGIKLLLKKAVANIDFPDEVERLSEEFGLRLVTFRSAGFKADYFAAIADSTITECSFLDNAVHPAHQTLQAFSQFVGIVFTSVRNGFYNEMRRQRRASHSFSSGQSIAMDRRPKLSISGPSTSPTTRTKLLTEFWSPQVLVNGSDQFLSTPQDAFY
ncbi:unnamed protein product [Bursaphelenchus xylophilus]|uniref:(pine wood nematode) hypothetical protein n=1 Tax=Bursaphelenchus xylophilus TaxID=6326 RepID=A0A7I8WQM7_BURXY|nr:unnamed protein product [Bursaphelenchus xylophilus]CAG9096845.1 unnamed protein product [Bursaphelenchus xylophilus]